jgi:hypothetical protein
VFLDDKANPGAKKAMFREMESLGGIQDVNTQGNHHLDLILDPALWLNGDKPERIRRKMSLNSRQNVLKFFDTRVMDERFEFKQNNLGTVYFVKPNRSTDTTGDDREEPQDSDSTLNNDSDSEAGSNSDPSDSDSDMGHGGRLVGKRHETQVHAGR